MLRGALAWLKLVAPNWLNVGVVLGLPNRGALKAFNTSVRNSICKLSLDAERSEEGGVQLHGNAGADAAKLRIRQRDQRRINRRFAVAAAGKGSAFVRTPR